eukprot:TRINITY_DN1494_c0_g1_i7.p1 TRINITY_DN1494_c0_g1~~TRINITY_DN1494_c0_g1_i7.p1  ORF type:complete len:367 (-),score=73.53 TRINITY_DN1494_c0_g1_i7:96-1196(-)
MNLNYKNNKCRQFLKIKLISSIQKLIDQGDCQRLVIGKGWSMSANQMNLMQLRNSQRMQRRNYQNSMENYRNQQKLLKPLLMKIDNQKNSNDELTYQIKVIASKLNDLQNLVNNLRNENQKKDEENSELENQIQNLKVLNDEIKMKLNEAQRLLEQYKDYDKKIEMLTQENNALKNELALLLNRLKALEGDSDKLNQFKTRIDELEQLLIEKENQIEDLTNQLKKVTKQFNQVQTKCEQIYQNCNEIEQKCNVREKQCEQLIIEAGKWQKKYELIKVQIDGFKELDVIAQEYDQKLYEIPRAISKVIEDFCNKKTGEMELWRNKYTDELSKVLNSQEARDLQNVESVQITSQSISPSLDYRYTSKF